VELNPADRAIKLVFFRFPLPSYRSIGANMRRDCSEACAGFARTAWRLTRQKMSQA